MMFARTTADIGAAPVAHREALDRRNTIGVVPANAGIHTARYQRQARGEYHPQTIKSRGAMGPAVAETTAERVAAVPIQTAAVVHAVSGRQPLSDGLSGKSVVALHANDRRCAGLSTQTALRRTAEFTRAFNRVVHVKRLREKYSDFFFTEIMIFYPHPASCRGRTRGRHDT
jgi:hypothetical protein